jgi:hypothetical protein
MDWMYLCMMHVACCTTHLVLRRAPPGWSRGGHQFAAGGRSAPAMRSSSPTVSHSSPCSTGAAGHYRDCSPEKARRRSQPGGQVEERMDGMGDLCCAHRERCSPRKLSRRHQRACSAGRLERSSDCVEVLCQMSSTLRRKPPARPAKQACDPKCVPVFRNDVFRFLQCVALRPQTCTSRAPCEGSRQARRV